MVRDDLVLHLHRLDDNEHLSGLDLLTGGDPDPEHRALVEAFPPGHRWTSDGDLHPFRQLHVSGPELTDRAQAVTMLRETVVTAVRRRMMADVPVGVFLSGGLDSSVVAAIMARAAEPGSVVHSFAAGTPGSSDLAAARVVADTLGLEHHERVYTDEDVVEALPRVVAATESYEPSLIRSAVPNYLLAELAARHVKVVLTGEGLRQSEALFRTLFTRPD